MLIYSHMVIASLLESHVMPVNKQDYYLGSIAPDIRYYAEIPRQQTHLPLGQIIEYVNEYPHLTSFLQGYFIHCASENLPKEAGLNESVLRQFPFSLKTVQNKLPKSFISIVLAFYHLEKSRIPSNVAETGNEILRDLGIDDGVTQEFARKMNQFLMEPSLSSGMSALQDLGLLRNQGLNRYLQVVRFIRIGIVKRWLFSTFSKSINDFHETAIPIMIERYVPLLQRNN